MEQEKIAYLGEFEIESNEDGESIIRVSDDLTLELSDFILARTSRFDGVCSISNVFAYAIRFTLDDSHVRLFLIQ